MDTDVQYDEDEGIKKPRASTGLAKYLPPP